MAAPQSETTLQINLSGGDLAYAEQTVPWLVAAHPNVAERLAVVDLCRPGRTQVVDPDAKFPERAFRERAARIEAMAESFRERGWIDRVVRLREGDPLIGELSRKYAGGWVRETHDCWGFALMSYLAAVEVPRTRYVIHYDADILLHQAPGTDWAVEAIGWMRDQERAVAATPRISPPFARWTGHPDAPSLHEGLPATPVPGGWSNAWFSTRALLVDRERLERYLPLLRPPYLLEVLARKTLRRSYPPSPEIMLFRGVGGRGGWRLNLSAETSWLLHPVVKTPEYVALLPRIKASVDRGEVPESQRGYMDIKLDDWKEFLARGA